MRTTLLITTLVILSFSVSTKAQYSFYTKHNNNGNIEAVERSKSIYISAKTNPLKYANMDTLLYLPFDGDSAVPDQNNGGNWLNISYDNLTAANNLPTDFFLFDSVAVQDLATGDTLKFTTLLGSASWMENLENGNRNALISPQIQISQPGAVFSFSSMPSQGPQWQDGYTIKVDLQGDPLSANADTLMQHKQYRGVGDGPLWNPIYGWDTIPGDTLHTAYNYDPTLASFTDSGNTTVAMMDWEFSLDAYVGQSIYIIIYHDSDDDNAIMIDDLLLVEPRATGLKDENKNYSRIYPNPSNGLLTFEYLLEEGHENVAHIYDMKGREVLSPEIKDDGFGVQKLNVITENLDMGVYMIQFYNGKYLLKEKLYIK